MRNPFKKQTEEEKSNGDEFDAVGEDNAGGKSAQWLIKVYSMIGVLVLTLVLIALIEVADRSLPPADRLNFDYNSGTQSRSATSLQTVRVSPTEALPSTSDIVPSSHATNTLRRRQQDVAASTITLDSVLVFSTQTITGSLVVLSSTTIVSNGIVTTFFPSPVTTTTTITTGFVTVQTVTPSSVASQVSSASSVQSQASTPSSVQSQASTPSSVQSQASTPSSIQSQASTPSSIQSLPSSIVSIPSSTPAASSAQPSVAQSTPSSTPTQVPTQTPTSTPSQPISSPDPSTTTSIAVAIARRGGFLDLLLHPRDLFRRQNSLSTVTLPTTVTSVVVVTPPPITTTIFSNFVSIVLSTSTPLVTSTITSTSFIVTVVTVSSTTSAPSSTLSSTSISSSTTSTPSSVISSTPTLSDTSSSTTSQATGTSATLSQSTDASISNGITDTTTSTSSVSSATDSLSSSASSAATPDPASSTSTPVIAPVPVATNSAAVSSLQSSASVASSSALAASSSAAAASSSALAASTSAAGLASSLSSAQASASSAGSSASVASVAASSAASVASSAASVAATATDQSASTSAAALIAAASNAASSASVAQQAAQSADSAASSVSQAASQASQAASSLAVVAAAAASDSSNAQAASQDASNAVTAAAIAGGIDASAGSGTSNGAANAGATNGQTAGNGQAANGQAASNGGGASAAADSQGVTAGASSGSSGSVSTGGGDFAGSGGDGAGSGSDGGAAGSSTGSSNSITPDAFSSAFPFLSKHAVIPAAKSFVAGYMPGSIASGFGAATAAFQSQAMDLAPFNNPTVSSMFGDVDAMSVFTFLPTIAALALVAVAPAGIAYNTTYGCSNPNPATPLNPCPPILTSNHQVLRGMQGGLAVIAVVTVTVVVMWFAKPSGASCDPCSIAGIAAVGGHPQVASDFACAAGSSTRELRKRVDGNRYRIGEWNADDGTKRFGIKPDTEPVEPGFMDKIKSKLPEMPHIAFVDATLDWIDVNWQKWGTITDSIFVVYVTVIVAIASAYLRSGDKSVFAPIFANPTTGRRIAFSIVGGLVSKYISTVDRDTQTLAPYMDLQTRNAFPKSSIILRKHSLPITAFFPLVFARHWVPAAVTLSVLLGQFLIVTMTGMPAREGQTHGEFVFCTATSLSILVFIAITVIVSNIWRRRLPYLPRKPDNVAAVLSYVAGSQVCANFEGVERARIPVRDRRIITLGRKYGFDVKPAHETKPERLVIDEMGSSDAGSETNVTREYYITPGKK